MKSNDWTARLRDHFILCKPRISLLVVFTAMVGMLMAIPSGGIGTVAWDVLITGSLGIGLAAAAAATLNHIVDQRIDAIMARTVGRPLPKGRVSPRQAAWFAATLTILSTFVLACLVNVLTAVLTLLCLIGYSVIYSMFLKRATPQNIVIGGVSGAAPPILGWTAMTGTIDANALLLCLIIFVWTPPHFWALAICRREEYAEASVPMLPVTHGAAFTRLHILLYTIVLCLVCLLPWLTRMSGLIYLCCVLPLNAIFLYHAARMYRSPEDRHAARTFEYSIHYLYMLFAALLLDHFFLILL